MFKYISLGLIFALFSACLRATYQEKRLSKHEIPQAVKTYLAKEYPNAQYIKYYQEKTKDTIIYEVELQHQQEALSIRFYADGKLFELEKSVAYSELPQQVRTKIEQELQVRFEKYQILEVEFLNPHLQTQYEIKVKGKGKNGRQMIEFWFDKDGNLMHFQEYFLKPIQTLF